MTNLTIVRDILNAEIIRRKARTVWSARLNADAMIEVRAVNEISRDALHQEYPYDFEKSCKIAVEEIAGYPVEKIGQGAAGDLLWLAVAD